MSKTTVDISVIICTYNRWKNLEQCFDHLLGQKGIGDISWEIVLVDNNSSDKTRETTEGYAASKNANIRYIFEPTQGLNHARNKGVKESKGKYFTFVDDDILVSKQWLSSLYTSLVENDADSVGGRIHLDPSLPIPKWITPDMYGFLGYQDYGKSPLQLDGHYKYPFGGNMSFNKRVVEKIGYFNTNLGRKGEGRKSDELFKGAETDYFHRLTETKNARIFYQPDAIVFHQILPHQLTQKYFLTIHRNAGYQKAFHDQTKYSRTLAGIPLFIIPQTIRAVGNYLTLVLTKGSDVAFRQKMTVAHFIGMVMGYRKQKLAPSK